MAYTSTVTMKFSVQDWEAYMTEKERTEKLVEELEGALAIVRANEKELIMENIRLREKLGLGSRYAEPVITEEQSSPEQNSAPEYEYKGFWSWMKDCWNKELA